MAKMVSFMLYFYTTRKRKGRSYLYKHLLNYCQMFKRRISGSVQPLEKKMYYGEFQHIDLVPLPKQKQKQKQKQNM